MKNDDLLKEILTRGVNKDDLPKLIHENLFLNLFNGFPHRHELIDYNMLGYTIVSSENTPCTNAANHIKNWDYKWMSKKCVTHEVIAVDSANNYAVIQHNIYQTRICDVCLRAHISSLHPNQDEILYSSYILCGINSDDEMYFLHPLFRAPEELINRARNHSDAMSVVKWCNKEDMGFEGRIQGDIIFAEVELRISEILAHKDYIDEVIYEFTIGKNTKMRIALSLHTHPGEKFMACDWQHDLKSLINYIKTHSERQDMTIGNRHELKTDGIITGILNETLPFEMDIWSSVDLFNTSVILGSELVMHHRASYC
jgi:hypothetical protein